MSRSLKWAAAGVVSAGLAGVLLWPSARPELRLPEPAAADPEARPEVRREVPKSTPLEPAVAPPTTTASTGAVRTPALGESELMVQLRELTESDPTKAIELARDAQARLPNSPDAPERGWVIAKSLTNLQRFQEARDEARRVVERYPGTAWAADVERHLLTNPLDYPTREQQQQLERELQGMDGG